METPQTPPTNTNPESKQPLRSFRFAKPLPPDHWIYTQGPQLGFVRGLPQSLKDLQAAAANARVEKLSDDKPGEPTQSLNPDAGREL